MVKLVRKRKTNTVYSCICMEYRKMVPMILLGSKGARDVKNRLLDSVGEGEGRMI